MGKLCRTITFVSSIKGRRAALSYKEAWVSAAAAPWQRRVNAVAARPSRRTRSINQQRTNYANPGTRAVKRSILTQRRHTWSFHHTLGGTSIWAQEERVFMDDLLHLMVWYEIIKGGGGLKQLHLTGNTSHRQIHTERSKQATEERVHSLSCRKQQIHSSKNSKKSFKSTEKNTITH